jgi:hypothetical protein
MVIDMRAILMKVYTMGMGFIRVGRMVCIRVSFRMGFIMEKDHIFGVRRCCIVGSIGMD